MSHAATPGKLDLELQFESQFQRNQHGGKLQLHQSHHHHSYTGILSI